MSSDKDVFIVVKERSAGNAEVGEMWVETCTFGPQNTLAEVWAWQQYLGSGRLMLTKEERRGAPEAS